MGSLNPSEIRAEPMPGQQIQVKKIGRNEPKKMSKQNKIALLNGTQLI